MEIKKLLKFIQKAKINTYAGDAEEKKHGDGSKELIYGEGGFKYKDKYFGYNPFIGNEVIYSNNIVVWGMNYYGGVVCQDIPENEVYEFLKEALKKVPEDSPFRGPKNFKKLDLEYINKIHGDVERFLGVETIFHKGKKIYQLYYQGGVLES